MAWSALCRSLVRGAPPGLVKTLALLIMLVGPLLSGPAKAQLPNEDLLCGPADPQMSPHRYLRAVSLDLRGRVPSVEEYAALTEVLEGEGADQAEAWIADQLDAWLDAPEFVQRAVRRHQSLFWNNVTNVRPLDVNAGLRRSGELFWRTNLAQRLYRGARVSCLDEPARFDRQGRILTTEMPDGTRREGYVEVRPYWAPDQTLKVCAFDAQPHLTSERGTDCSSRDAYRDEGCGCGPELRWCRFGNSSRLVMEAMAEAVDRRVAQMVADDKPYLELFTGRTTFVNGPLVHFWTHQRKLGRGLTFEPAPLDVESLPDLAFTEVDTWVEVPLHADHAGVLTEPAFLLRFQTNRARANRFYDAFLCQPFSPPDAPLPVATPEAILEPDLQLRAGCKYCHALLEPSAAFWGRWSEQGAGYLSPEDFPRAREDCVICATTGAGCSAECRRFYVTRAFSDKESEYLGTLQAYQFRREDHARNVEQGPRLLALTGVADNRLPQCVARRSAEWLFGRDLDTEEQAWMTDLTRAFVAGDYRYRDLIRAVVQSPTYRRVR